MQVQVNGRHLKVGKALSEYVRDRLRSSVGKYFDRPLDAHVTFSREARLYRSDCAVHAGHGINLQSHAEADDMQASFELAIDRIEKRLRRYKRRLAKYHSSRADSPDQERVVPSYVIEPEEEDQEAAEDFQPVIVAETSTSIPTLSVGEAVMQMDLADSAALMFHGASDGAINMVYRRADGNIGWVDASNAAH